MPAHLLELQEGGVHGEAAAPALRVLHPLALELETKVHTRFEVESGYYRFHIKDTMLNGR